MSAGFKAQIKRDLAAVFHNADEHADKLNVEYSGKTYNIPVVIDHEGAKDRQQPSNDHAGGIFIADLRVYISLYDIRIVPRKEAKIALNGTEYRIIRVGCDSGEITLDLEMLDE